MVISLLSTCSINGSGSPVPWRHSPEPASPEAEQETDCMLNFNNRDESFNNNDQSFQNHDRKPSSPVQEGEENSCYGSENATDNLSPPQETSRSSGSEDLGVHLFPISSCNTTSHGFDYSNSDNESMSGSPPGHFTDDDLFRAGTGTNGANSAKAKVHKCRSCDFTTTDKHESWKHIESHLKPEKILRCTQCPFVTEYKHHLDFHIQNHEGLKPYRCDKCSYHCVNKSMLKSHSKSHSNVYQFSCRDCLYRTKYCHSLKIHLRKYGHQPGTVLDPDGKPNPNPVIDVYGNRRGPRQKSKKTETATSAVASKTVTASTVLPLQPPIPTLNAFPNLSWVNNMYFAENTRIPCPIISMGATAFVNEPRIASQESDNLNNNIKIPILNNASRSSSLKTLNNNNNANVNNLNCSLSGSKEKSNNLNNSLDSVKKQSLSDDEEMTFRSETSAEEASMASSFLVPMPRGVDMAQPSSVEEAPLNLTVSHAPPSTPTVKNRRKGVACKLKRSAIDDPDTGDVGTSPPGKIVQISELEELQHSSDIEETDRARQELLAKLKKEKPHSCKHCDITFFNKIMYTMHMGYHGYLDPFTCNRCGKKTENKFDFYAHMISEAH